MPIRLALSLHAPNDALRSELMPVNDRYPLADVLAACHRYHRARRRMVFVEYVMLAGVNDTRELAAELATILDPRVFKLNLIPYNPTGEEFEGSDPRGDPRVQGGARAWRPTGDRAADPRPRHRRGLRAARGEGLVGSRSSATPSARATGRAVRP